MFDTSSFEWLRWAAMIVMLCVVFLCLLFIARNPLGKGSTISHHIASNRLNYYAMGITLTVGGAIFYAFLLLWLIPTYALPQLLYFILPIVFIAQLIVAWAPDKGVPSTSQKLHIFAAWIVALCMLFILLSIVLVLPTLPLISAVLVCIAIAYSLLCLVLYVFVKKSHQSILVYEGIFIALFYVAIFALLLKI